MVAIFLFGWMVVICARLVQLQTSQHEWLTQRARAQQQDATVESPERGLILDRTGRELARTVDVDSFFAVPQEIEDIDDASARLAPLLKLERAQLASRLREARERGLKFVWLARKVEAERGEAVRALKVKGIHARTEPQRRYPNGELAAHIVGFVGLDDEGLGGVERFHNTSMKGVEGKIVVEGDGRRKAYASLEINPQAGQSVVLTIDETIQFHAERALALALQRTRAKSATAIVLEPRTGEILALANAPTFNPNEAGKASAASRTNQALQNIYEPGSTFKIVAFSAALEERLGRPEDKIDCQMGRITVAGRLVHDHSAFGTLTLTEALAKSSNVAAIKLGIRVGDERMYEYIRRYGFGARTGIELPGETPGLLRPVARWQASSIGSIAIGQEIGVTPLQMASAFGALANDGVRVAPHLVRELRAADGSVVAQTKPESQRVLSAETARTVRGMLESVTVKGTAKAAQLEGYTAAGKTGTAQKIDTQTRTYSKTKHVASFVGFAPVENPSVVIVVVVDEPAGAYHGGDVAAPVFREIAEQVLPYLNVLPDAEIKSTATGERLLARDAAQETDERKTPDTKDAQASSPHEYLPEVGKQEASGGEVIYAEAGQRALLMPNLRGRSVRDAMRICAQLGLELEASGEGRALRQSPAAGASVEAGQMIRVEFGRSD
ncbi:MAG TPA: penicillin-binding protein [Pyrinomonadaceae bacterium]|nr:penicillin-binding protein [Pyrinomonadaceae bacterium]